MQEWPVRIETEADLADRFHAALADERVLDFRRRYPDVLLDTEPIYVKDGNLYTSAGVTSILDLMLALVEEDFGSELATTRKSAMSSPTSRRTRAPT